MPDVRAAEDRDADRLLPDRPLGLAREPRHDLVEEVAGAVPVEGRERDRVAEPEPVEIERLVVAPRVVELVGENEHLAPRAAQDLGELLVAGSDPRSRVDDEEHEIGLLDRLPRLLGDLRSERARVGPVDASGVDQPERRPRPLAQELLAVARHPRRLVDDSGARLAQAVDEGRLADVRVADDRDRPRDLDGLLSRRIGLPRPPRPHLGGVASRGRPSSWISPSHSHSSRSFRSISTEASL